ncbi:MAG: SRPBCC family protein [Gemmatimonadetes bacterium]|nr:SRPBCC family protein [Gemmatimonadota bacterium]
MPTARPHILETSMTLPLPREQVFAFFADAGNLERITPPNLHFEILAGRNILITEGMLIDYKLRLLGVPFAWQSRISRWEPPAIFVDEQLRGPYDLWIHTHTFTEEDGVTTIADRVQYRLPLWPLGEIALPLVRLQLRHIFAYRQRIIRHIFLPPEQSLP